MSCSWRSSSIRATTWRQFPDHNLDNSPLQHVSYQAALSCTAPNKGRRGRATALSAVARKAEGERHFCVGHVSCPCVWCHVSSCTTLRLILSGTFHSIFNLNVIQFETCIYVYSRHHTQVHDIAVLVLLHPSIHNSI